jgi:hypothetical protein
MPRGIPKSGVRDPAANAAMHTPEARAKARASYAHRHALKVIRDLSGINAQVVDEEIAKLENEVTLLKRLRTLIPDRPSIRHFDPMAALALRIGEYLQRVGCAKARVIAADLLVGESDVLAVLKAETGKNGRLRVTETIAGWKLTSDD